MSEQNNGRFVKSWFYHGVKLTKWENVNGERKSVSFSIEKSYKDKATNEYKQSKTFFSDDLDALLQCIISAKQESVKVILPKGESTNVQENKNADLENVPF